MFVNEVGEVIELREMLRQYLDTVVSAEHIAFFMRVFDLLVSHPGGATVVVCDEHWACSTSSDGHPAALHAVTVDGGRLRDCFRRFGRDAMAHSDRFLAILQAVREP